MKPKGFTFLELIVVITVLGIIATLGIHEFYNMGEKSRAAEGKTIVGNMRKLAYAYRLEYGSIDGITTTQMNRGAASNQYPSACRASHYFSYSYAADDPVITISATRCTTGGKTPPASSTTTVRLRTDFDTGADTWTGRY